MKKFTLILTIAVLCSFAAVRRREKEDIDEFFQNAITRVIEDESLVYSVMDDHDEIGNINNLLMDYPTGASKLLKASWDSGLLVMNGNKASFLDFSELDDTQYGNGKKWLRHQMN